MGQLSGLLIVMALVCAPGPSGQTEDADTPQAAGIHVTEYGVGTGVEARNLVGKAESFPEGSRVWFWTRVVGGAEGDRVRHVWIREGTEVFSIGLAIGSDNWRTYSNKTMHVGSVGNWAAEVRSADDRLLARQEFRCTARE